MFHELGHGMHSLLSRTKYARFHGTSVGQDFVETPAMMLENLLWTPRHMKEISFHYSHISPGLKLIWQQSLKEPGIATEVPEKLSDRVVEALIANRLGNTAISTLTKVHHSTYDMKVHNSSSRASLEETDFTVLFNKTRREIIGLKGGEEIGEGWDWSYGQTSFRAIVGKYDVGYYTYIL